MVSSGTTAFNPSSGEIILYAFGLCGIRRAEITQEHLTDARMAANLLLAEWDNATPNLWKVELVETALSQGIATYDVDPSTVMILDAYIRMNEGDEDQYDRIIWPISRTDYASYPDKLVQAPPTTFWFDRLLAPTITLWQVPDENGPYTLVYYAVTQVFDAALGAGQTLDLPVWWMNAFAYGLASNLADSYAPDRGDGLAAKAAKALQKALDQNVENVPLTIAPALSEFFPR